MVKVEAVEKFTLEAFDELQNIERKGAGVKGTLYVGDTFECSKEMADYLTGNNPLGKTVVRVVEVQPEPVKIDINKMFVLKDIPSPEELEKTKPKSKKKKNK